MLHYPHLNPIALKLGPLKIHWYGLMYLLGYIFAWLFCSYRAKRRDIGLDQEAVTDLIFYGALGVIIGGRVGYMVFYDTQTLLNHPLSLFKIWQGGMSFHGGLLGVLLALWFYAKKIERPFTFLTDFLAPVVPLGLAAGRMGNFINGELWGRVTTVPWGMIYPQAGPLPRHPSELYEFSLEGIVLFLILWFYSQKPRPRMAVSAVFLLGYGCFRFFCECFRQPDPQLGFIAFGWLTQGQLLSIPMIVMGVILLIYAYRAIRNDSDTPQ